MTDALNILPDEGLSETLEWLTSVHVSHDGTEQRETLRRYPRITQSAKWDVLDPAEFRDLFRIVWRDLQQAATVPLWALAASLKTESFTGATRIYFTPGYCQLSVGAPIVLLNPHTRESQVSTVLTVHADGVTLADFLAQDVNKSWFAIRGMSALVNDGQSFTQRQVTAEFQLTTESASSDPLVRADSAAVLTTFDGLPVLERSALEGGAIALEYDRDVIDFDLGAKIAFSSRLMPIQLMRREFIMYRTVADTDYWFTFLDTVRGAWKAFLCSTQFLDLSLVAAPVAGATGLTVNEAWASEALHVHEAFKRIEILYGDGSKSWHTLTGSIAGALTVSPALPNDPKVSNVQRVSYLVKCRMADKITLTHNSTETKIALAVRTTNEG